MASLQNHVSLFLILYINPSVCFSGEQVQGLSSRSPVPPLPASGWLLPRGWVPYPDGTRAGNISLLPDVGAVPQSCTRTCWTELNSSERTALSLVLRAQSGHFCPCTDRMQS